MKKVFLVFYLLTALMNFSFGKTAASDAFNAVVYRVENHAAEYKPLPAGTSITLPRSIAGTIYISNADALGYNAFDTLYVDAALGFYRFMEIHKLHGASPTHKIVICNKNGKVIFSDTMTTVNYFDCENVKMTSRNEDSATRDGFLMTGGVDHLGRYRGVGIGVSGYSSNFEFSYFTIFRKAYGMEIKNEMSCDTALFNYRMYYFTIHDFYIHVIGYLTAGEGMYLGTSSPNGYDSLNTSRWVPCKYCGTCDTVIIKPGVNRHGSYIGGFEIYNGTIDSTMRSNLQFSAGDGPQSHFYNLILRNAGRGFEDGQGFNFVAGGRSHFTFKNNNCYNAYSANIGNLGSGNDTILNNVCRNAGKLEGHTHALQPNILNDTRPTLPVDSQRVYIVGNIIDSASDYNIRFYKSQPTYYTSGTVVCGNTGTMNIAAGINYSTTCDTTTHHDVDTTSGPAIQVTMVTDFIKKITTVNYSNGQQLIVTPVFTRKKNFTLVTIKIPD